jgi:hypothetical protein
MLLQVLAGLTNCLEGLRELVDLGRLPAQLKRGSQQRSLLLQ